ncbi:MAG: Spy/CpxP family protein refolding chaperone [Prevotella sp.]
MIIAVLVLMGAISTFAQRGGGRQRMTVEEQVANMHKELNLTSSQQKKLTALYQDFNNKRQENTQMSREQMRTERENLDKQVSALLTDTQKKKFEEMKKARRGGGRGNNK